MTFRRLVIYMPHIMIFGAILVKAVFALIFMEPKLFEGHDIALQMLETGDLKYFLNGVWHYNYQFPVYPTLLYFIYIIGGAHVGLSIVFNVIISCLGGYFLLGIGRWIFDNGVSNTIIRGKELILLLTLLAYLVHPGISYYAMGTVHPFSLDQFMALGIVYLSLRTSKNCGYGHLLLLGLFCGFSILNRPSLICFTLPYFILVSRGFGLKSILPRIALPVLLMIVPMSLWLVRNYSIYGEWTVSSATGQNLWIGIQEATSGTTYMVNGENYYKLLTDSDKRTITNSTSLDQNRYYFNKYLSETNENPTVVLKMFFIKLKNFWWFHPFAGENLGKIKSYITVYKTVYGFILILFLIGLFLPIRNKAALYAPLLAISLFQAFFYVESRHRVLIEPFMILFSFIALYYIFVTFVKQPKSEIR